MKLQNLDDLGRVLEALEFQGTLTGFIGLYRDQSLRIRRGFPRISGTIIWVPLIRILRSILGLPFLWKLPDICIYIYYNTYIYIYTYYCMEFGFSFHGLRVEEFKLLDLRGGTKQERSWVNPSTKT